MSDKRELQGRIDELDLQFKIALEEAEHAENELLELKADVAAEKAREAGREWILDALKAARRAAGHTDLCESVYRPHPDNFCTCGRGNIPPR